MHSLGVIARRLFANLVSKFVTKSHIIIRDSNEEEGFVKVIVTTPYLIRSANVDQTGQINIIVGKEIDHGRSNY